MHRSSHNPDEEPTVLYTSSVEALQAELAALADLDHDADATFDTEGEPAPGTDRTPTPDAPVLPFGEMLGWALVGGVLGLGVAALLAVAVGL
ncbi:MAG: hypothetical protein R3F61_29935 [Myxococcota bacterium]